MELHHFATKKQVAWLYLIFGKPTQSEEAGGLVWIAPEWLEQMYNYCKR